MENFETLGLSESLLSALTAMQYNTPTPIQAQTIPHAIKGLDVLGTAQTGTGKTAAYGIPLISYLLNSTDGTALVLTPTRELAMQVLALIQQILGRKTSIRAALIIGGDPIGRQLNQLKMNPRIIVGTPGRINDHLDRGTLKLDKAKFLVLDETDRMLDMGFGIQLEEIAKFLPVKRQTLMFSATLPNDINKVAAKYLKSDAVRVSIGSTIAAADTIKQEIIRTSELEKHGVLLQQLEINTGTVIIFVKTKMATEKLANKLRDHGHSADAIHGDLRQRSRERVIRAFRNKKHRILVATDVAARGLDISHLECVINHDLPQCEEDFIHRIGRTGRAGVEGIAISLITPQDHAKWRNISKMMNPGMKLDSSFDDPEFIRKTRGKSSGDRSSRNGDRKSFIKSGGFNARRSEEKVSPSSTGRFSARKTDGRSISLASGSGPRKSEGRNSPLSLGGSSARKTEGRSAPSSSGLAVRRSEGRNTSSSLRSNARIFTPGGEERRSKGNSFKSNDSNFRKLEAKKSSGNRKFGENSSFKVASSARKSFGGGNRKSGGFDSLRRPKNTNF